MLLLSTFLFFFFNDTATTEIYTLSLHDALPICADQRRKRHGQGAHRQSDSLRLDTRRQGVRAGEHRLDSRGPPDRKSTRLNSSHGYISYAVFCLKKKKKNAQPYKIK